MSLNWSYVVTIKGSQLRLTGILPGKNAYEVEGLIRSKSTGIPWPRATVRVTPTIEEPTDA